MNFKHQTSNFKTNLKSQIRNILNWKLVIGICFGFWILSFGFAAEAALDLSQIGVGARALGLGRAYAGGINDASSIFTNPAELANSQELNFTSMSGTMFSDINYLLFGLTNLSPVGKIGIGYISASVGGIPITATTGSGSTFAVVQTTTTDYTSGIIYLSFSRKLDAFLKGKLESVSLGLNVKLFNQGFQGGGAVMQDAVGSGMDADLGLIWQAKDWAKIGMVFNNFLPTDYGGKFTWQKNNVTESIPMIVRTGGTFKILGVKGMRKIDNQELSLFIDHESFRESTQPAAWHAGLEYWPVTIMAMRLGLDQVPRAAESGISVDNNFSAGIGIKFNGFTFDYAYHQFGELSENTTHFFSLGYVGEKIEASKKHFGKEEKTITIPLAEVVIKPTLKSFVDVPDNYWLKNPIAYLTTMGIMDSYPDGSFRPEKPITRAELAMILVKAKGFEVAPVGRPSFSDVDPNGVATPYIEMAVKRGYMEGYTNATFKPDKAVTRAEAAIILSRFSGFYIKSQVDQDVYPDVTVDHWAAPAIAAAKGAGLFEYLGENRFGPKDNLTRAEAAEILSKTPFVKEKIKKFIIGETV